MNIFFKVDKILITVIIFKQLYKIQLIFKNTSNSKKVTIQLMK